METMTLDNDIRAFYVAARSFPDGVLEAHQKLHSLVPLSTDRKYFGVSRPENGGGIAYKAAAEELQEGEAEQLNCPTLVLKKGKYICQAINDYMKNIPAIGSTFQQLLSNPDIDPDGYCLEWYLNDKDLKCMVRLKD